ncbi:MAG: SDR family NAD(P)-dependent oxidoreductase [Phyllobacterium sp.]
MSESRVALISGASRGIGEAIARSLAEAGWQISLAMRDPVLPSWADAENTQIVAYDAARSQEQNWVGEALKRFGRIDALVANAGIMIPKNVIEAEDADLDAMLDVNVKAPRRLAAAAWDALCVSGRGRVIILGSLSGKRVKSASAGLYSISKFAAVALAHGIRQAGWESGIRATALCPGFVATDMARSLTDRDAGAMTQPSDIARIALMLLDLPNEASVAEFTINCQLEEMY